MAPWSHLNWKHIILFLTRDAKPLKMKTGCQAKKKVSCRDYKFRNMQVHQEEQAFFLGGGWFLIFDSLLPPAGLTQGVLCHNLFSILESTAGLPGQLSAKLSSEPPVSPSVTDFTRSQECKMWKEERKEGMASSSSTLYSRFSLQVGRN